MSEEQIMPGHCSGCLAPAERGPSGCWWHVRREDSCGRNDARFTPGAPEQRQQPQSPRDRQIRDPGRNR